MDLSIVIPCYNEEESLKELHRRVTVAASQADIKTYELILVNDGSTDRTFERMKELAENDPNLVIVNLSRNHGHQLALSAGLAEAKGEYTLVLDADLQDPPELLQPMLDKARSGVDVVYGQRLTRAGETWFKLFMARMFYRILSYLSETQIPENVGDFRLMHRRVLDTLLSMPEQQRFIRGMIAWIGFKQEAFPYERDPRFAGETKYPFMKLVHFAIDAISSFSIRPLRMAIPFALFGAALAALLGLYAVISFFYTNVFPGWTSLACIITFFSAVQLLCIALIGEYIGRTYIEVKRRPLFIVADVIRGKAKPKAQIKKAAPKKTATKSAAAKPKTKAKT